MGQKLVVQLSDQLDRARVGRIERKPRLVPESPGEGESIRAFGQLDVGWEFKPALHVAKGVLVGHQFDESILAVFVEFENFLTGERAGVGPDIGVAPVGKGMFGIELKLVDLEGCQLID